MSVRISDKHGVNPSVEKCFVCGEDKGVVLFGRLKGDAEAPRSVCLDYEPCDECKRWMEQGVILISVDEKRSKSSPQNPWRTGGWVVMKDDAIRRMFKPESLVEVILKKRMAFVPDEAWDVLGLPRGEE